MTAPFTAMLGQAEQIKAAGPQAPAGDAARMAAFGALQPGAVATPGAMTPSMVPLTGGPTPGQQAPTWGTTGGQFQAFGPGNDLRGTAIMPGTSQTLGQYDQYVQGQAAQVAGNQFTPFASFDPVNYSTETGMLQGANSAMQGLGYNFAPANSAYQGALSTQTQAANRAGAMLAPLAAGGSFGGGGASADTSRFNTELDGALAGLEGPDRAALAAQTMDLLEERSRGGFNNALRETGQRAAALGRLGSGMTTNDLTGVLQSRENLLDRSRRELAIDAAGQTLNDRLAISDRQAGIAGQRFGGETFNAGLADAAAARGQQGAMFGANLARGVANDVYGMGRDSATLGMQVGDRSADQARDIVGLGVQQAGFTRGIANDLGNFTRDTYQSGVNERDAARADEFGRAGFGLQQLGALAGLQGQQRGFESGLRDEARGERDYQNSMERQAFERQIQQQQFNEWLRASGWDRAVQAGGMGFGNDPSGALANAGQTAGQQAGDMYGLLGLLGSAFGRSAGTGSGG